MTKQEVEQIKKLLNACSDLCRHLEQKDPQSREGVRWIDKQAAEVWNIVNRYE